MGGAFTARAVSNPGSPYAGRHWGPNMLAEAWPLRAWIRTDGSGGAGSFAKMNPEPQTSIGASRAATTGVIHWSTDPVPTRSASSSGAHATSRPNRRGISSAFIASPKLGSSFHQYTRKASEGTA